MIKTGIIRNFKAFRSLSLELNTDLNNILGENEA